MINYNAILEFDVKYTSDLIDQIIQHLDALRWDHSISENSSGNLEVRATLPAQNLGVASMLAAAEIQRAVGAEALRIDVTTETERNKEEPFILTGDGPEPLAVDEVAKILGRTDARVRQMIIEGKFRTARRIGSAWFVEMDEIREMLPTKEEINEFDFMGHKLDRLFLQDKGDLVELLRRLKAYTVGLDAYPQSEARDHMASVMEVWVNRVTNELDRRKAAKASNPKKDYAAQEAEDHWESSGEGTRRDMLD